MIVTWCDQAKGRLWLGKTAICLSPLEAKVADRLIRARGAAVTADQLIFAAYGGEGEPEDAPGTLKVVLCRLRTKGLPIEPRTKGHRCGYWLDGCAWFKSGQHFKVPTGTVRIERVLSEPSLIYYHETLGVSEAISLTDPRIATWEAL